MSASSRRRRQIHRPLTQNPARNLNTCFWVPGGLAGTRWVPKKSNMARSIVPYPVLPGVFPSTRMRCSRQAHANFEPPIKLTYPFISLELRHITYVEGASSLFILVILGCVEHSILRLSCRKVNHMQDTAKCGPCSKTNQ